MSNVNHKKVGDMDAITGMLEGVSMYRAAPDLGLTAFGMSIVELEPGADAYPEHDHDPEGMGGKMFEKRPEQLGQEEVYFALKGSGTVIADGEEFPLDPDHVIRVGPEVTRKVLPGPDGMRLLIVGATPGEAYRTGGTL